MIPLSQAPLPEKSERPISSGCRNFMGIALLVISVILLVAAFCGDITVNSVFLGIIGTMFACAGGAVLAWQGN